MVVVVVVNKLYIMYSYFPDGGNKIYVCICIYIYNTDNIKSIKENMYGND